MNRIRPKWVLKARFAPEGSLRCQTDNFVGCPVVAVKLTVLHNSLQVTTPLVQKVPPLAGLQLVKYFGFLTEFANANDIYASKLEGS